MLPSMSRSFRDPNITNTSGLTHEQGTLADELRRVNGDPEALTVAVSGQAIKDVRAACKFLLSENIYNPDRILRIAAACESTQLCNMVLKHVLDNKGLFSDGLVKEARQALNGALD